MSRLYTIGFAGKTARTFFGLLVANKVVAVLDIRLNNRSQLAGYTKKDDLEYFLEEIAGIRYSHIMAFAPTEQMLSDYRKRRITWPQYEDLYASLMRARKAEALLSETELADACFLCSEPTPARCHRRLLCEYLVSCGLGLQVVHI